ncbi:MAG: hypothetical protein RI920_1050, partial [Pseudomonadota bacterium]
WWVQREALKAAQPAHETSRARLARERAERAAQAKVGREAA